MTSYPVICIDFETYPIVRRPHYPPRPVGLATKWPSEPGKYLAFGHEAGGNNATQEDAIAELRRAYGSGLPLLFHHSKFDAEVALAFCGLDIPRWDRVHDTMFLAFLNDPHSRSLGLKQLADQHLGMPPDERDAMVDWCLAHKDLILEHFGEKFLSSQIGKWIWLVPGDIVGPYAIGDVERTTALWEHYQPTRERMGEAYDRERQVMPILLRNEQEGLRVDLEGLETDIVKFGSALAEVEEGLRYRLEAPDLNLDADQDVAERLASLGIVTDWSFTKPTKAHPQGLRSMSKETLTKGKYHDEQVFRVLGYRNRLKTTLDTFMRPWAEQARGNAGRITTNWNQVRSPEGGTRTGRPSTSDHNLLNVPKALEGRVSDGWSMPAGWELPPPPLCRAYILPDAGCLWLHRDFSGQELRMFAHAESGDLLQAYLDNPLLDPHAFTKARILEITGKELERTRVKNGTFARLYGGGVHAVQWQAQCKSAAEAKELIALLDRGNPGRKLVEEVIKGISRRGDPIVTWGGRWYYAEKAPGQDKTYKLLNYWDQGSCADLTKQALIEWDEQAQPWERFLITVYDEINIQAPVAAARESIARLGVVMDKDRIDCPMRSEAKIGPTWGSLKAEKDWTYV